MGYASYLPKTRFCCYHNTREVATHKIRNTVTHGEGYSPPFPGSTVSAV